MADRAPLTSPQFQSLNLHYQSQLSQIVSSLNLRRWLVEKTIGHGYSVEDLEKLHAFITHPTSTLTPPESQESQR